MAFNLRRAQNSNRRASHMAPSMDPSDDVQARDVPRKSSRAERRRLRMLADERDANRPVWEPRLHPSRRRNPESDPRVMDSLRNQGCQCPAKHYSDLYHNCNIPGRRLQCLREVHYFERHRPVVEAMASKLPEELLLEILEYVVSQTQPALHLGDESALPAAARTVIGKSPVVDKLQPLAEQVILNLSIITLDVVFQGDRGGKVAALAPFVASLPHSIQHFELPLRFDISFERQQYPGALYSATAGLKSLLSQLPRLKTLHLSLCISLNQNPRATGTAPHALNTSCRKGFSGMTTFKQAIVDLLDAARATRKGPSVSLELQYYCQYETWTLPGAGKIEAGLRPGLDVVNEADVLQV